MTPTEKYNEWTKSDYFDEKTRKELLDIRDNEAEIEDRFYRDLEFGTGGLRGVLGAGTNRMNIYTVRKATQGLANYIIKCNKQSQGVAIAYDCRHMSVEFSQEASRCLCANGIKVYRFESLRPTPELSFSVRELGCAAGIVITASHNPAEYNGYKVYWEDGAQITYPRDKDIIKEVNDIKDFSSVKVMTLEDAEKKNLYKEVGKDIDDKFMNSILALIKDKEALKAAKDMKIVYTPLHGTGNIPVRTILKKLGFNNIYAVEEQCVPDGSFPTVASPNPEDPNAFKMALELAKKVGADLIMGTDPDADRLGIYCRNPKTGEFCLFNGNMTGALLCEFTLDQMKRNNESFENGAIISTIATGKMILAIAKYYGVKCFETLTGFKYIGEYIHKFELEHSYNYLFGMEESYGCLPGTYARDKDAVGACVRLCEAAAYYRSKGLTLYEQMDNVYKKYGYYEEKLFFKIYKGADGVDKMTAILDKLRKNPLKQIDKYKVLNITDYENDDTGMVKSNVLYYELEDNAWFVVRPSGTEPKVKVYCGVKGNSKEDSEAKLSELLESVLVATDLK